MRGRNLRENQPQAAKRGEKGRNGCWAERREARHARVLETGFGMPPRAYIRRRIVSAEQVTQESADYGKQKSNSETDSIDEMFHRSELSYCRY